jgi:hypothetical protein
MAAAGVVCGLASSWVGSANAAPAPLPERVLRNGSDLIVEVDVQSVAKLGRPDAPVWCAQLSVRRVVKGRLLSNQLPYWFVPPQAGLVGERNDSVYPGQQLRMYLIRSKNGQYESWAQNSNQPLDNSPAVPRVLPTRFGQVIYAHFPCGDGRTQPAAN